MLLEVSEKTAEIGKIVFDGKVRKIFGFEVGFELGEDDLRVVNGLR